MRPDLSPLLRLLKLDLPGLGPVGRGRNSLLHLYEPAPVEVRTPDMDIELLHSMVEAQQMLER